MAHYGRGAPADRLEKNASKIRRLTGEMWPPAAGEDIMSAIYNVPVEEEDDEDDTGLGEMPSKHTLNLPMHPRPAAHADNNQPGPAPAAAAAAATTAPRRYTFEEGLDRLSEEVDQFAAALPATIKGRGNDDDDDNGGRVAAGIVRKLAASVSRRVGMRTMRERLGSTTAALSRTLRLAGRRGAWEEEGAAGGKKPAGAGAGAGAGTTGGDGGESSLARRLFGRNKKPKRPPIPEGWLFGPPPE